MSTPNKITITKSGRGKNREQTITIEPPQTEAEPTAKTIAEEAPSAKPLSDIPDLAGIITIGAVAALAAYAATWFVRSLLKVKGGTWHWKLRLTALVSGGLAGFFLGGWPWGAIVGLCGGALTTVVVAAVKSRISKAG